MEGQKRQWDTDKERERKRAYRERKRAELEESGLPERQLDEDEPIEDYRDARVLMALPLDAVLTDEEEQRIRDHLGYGPSEKRTRAERAGSAERMLDNGKLSEAEQAKVDAAIAKLQQAEAQHKQKQEAYPASTKTPSPAG